MKCKFERLETRAEDLELFKISSYRRDASDATKNIALKTSIYIYILSTGLGKIRMFQEGLSVALTALNG